MVTGMDYSLFPGWLQWLLNRMNILPCWRIIPHYSRRIIPKLIEQDYSHAAIWLTVMTLNILVCYWYSIESRRLTNDPNWWYQANYWLCVYWYSLLTLLGIVLTHFFIGTILILIYSYWQLLFKLLWWTNEGYDIVTQWMGGMTIGHYWDIIIILCIVWPGDWTLPDEEKYLIGRKRGTDHYLFLFIDLLFKHYSQGRTLDLTLTTTQLPPSPAHFYQPLEGLVLVLFSGIDRCCCARYSGDPVIILTYSLPDQCYMATKQVFLIHTFIETYSPSLYYYCDDNSHCC